MRAQPIPIGTRKFVVMRDHECCQAKLDGCTFTGTEIHHRKSRARGGTNDVDNLILLCNSCHRAITEHRPGTAKFRTSSWEQEGVTEG